jgi:hypothetical protein
LNGQEKIYSTFDFPRVALKGGETTYNTSPVVSGSFRNYLGQRSDSENSTGEKNRELKRKKKTRRKLITARVTLILVVSC